MVDGSAIDSGSLMRCFYASTSRGSFPRTLSCKIGFRGIGEISPDRNRNEKIQDIQNSFRWADRHIFRPHQHFTYDPSQWSRSAAASARQPSKLLERLANEKQALADSLTAESTSRSESSATNLLESESDSSHEPSLKSLIDRIEVLHEKLSAPRYRKYISVRSRQQLSVELQQKVVLLYHQLTEQFLRKSSTSSSMSEFVCSWSVLLEHVEPLVRGLMEYSQECTVMMGLLSNDDSVVLNESDPQLSCIREVYAQLVNMIFLSFHPDRDVKKLSPEVMVDLLDIWCHPFVLKCAALLEEEEELKERIDFEKLSDTANQFLLKINERITSMKPFRKGHSLTNDGASDQGGEEILSPLVVCSWTNAVYRMAQLHRNSNRFSTLSRLVLQSCSLIKRTSGNLQLMLRNSLSMSSGTQSGSIVLKQGLQSGKNYLRLGKSLSNVSPRASRAALSAVEFSPSVPSTGIVKPLTSGMDAPCLLNSTVLLMKLHELVTSLSDTAAYMSESLYRVLEVIDSVIETLSFCPNYDIDPHHLCEFCILLFQQQWLPSIVLESNVRSVSVAYTSEERLCRVLLILSRIPLDSSLSATEKTRLCYHLAQHLPDSALSTDSAPHLKALRLEVKRLRGTIFQKLLSTLNAEDFMELENSPTLTRPIEVLLSHARVKVPLPLWKNFCQARGVWPELPLPRSVTKRKGGPFTDDPSVYSSLLEIRSRHADKVDEITAQALDACAAKCLGSRKEPFVLLDNVEWANIEGKVGSEKVLSLLYNARNVLREINETSHSIIQPSHI